MITLQLIDEKRFQYNERFEDHRGNQSLMKNTFAEPPILQHVRAASKKRLPQGKELIKAIRQ